MASKNQLKKANTPEADTEERQREVAGMFNLYCEKAGDTQPPTPEATLGALDF